MMVVGGRSTTSATGFEGVAIGSGFGSGGGGGGGTVGVDGTHALKRSW